LPFLLTWVDLHSGHSIEVEICLTIQLALASDERTSRTTQQSYLNLTSVRDKEKDR
jgi:hypothetical protein